MAIRRILIANRGEIAARIIRTCRALDIEAVLAVSSADLTASRHDRPIVSCASARQGPRTAT